MRRIILKSLVLLILIGSAFLAGFYAHHHLNQKKQPSFICEGIITPQWADCFSNQSAINSLLKKEAGRHSIDWRFARAVLIKESHYIDYAVSGVGAVGLMQLMPRDGSYYTQNYYNMMKARKQKRDASGKRWYAGQSASQWADAYQKDLWQLIRLYKDKPEILYKKDRRFDPAWNIKSGVAQLARDYKKFRKRGHAEYGAMVYAAAAYNAGPGAVAVLKDKHRHDRIPVNRQTEYYVATVMKLYKALKAGNGRIRWKDRHILYE